MADISILSRLVNGIQRNVDISANTLVTTSIKVGGGITNTELTKAILDRLVSLQSGSDVDASYHTHDGRYFTETELGSSSASSGSDLIGDDNTYSNFTPAAATVKGALSGIDSALSTGSGRVKITATDTTSAYLNASISVDTGTNASAILESSVQNPGADETLRIRLDQSKIDHGSISGLGDDDHTIYTKADGTRAFTGNQSMGSNKLTSLASGTISTDAVNKGQLDTKADDAVVIKKDGSVAFTGNQSMGSNKLTSLADGTSAADAVNKGQLDTGLGLKVSKAGDTMSGNLAMGGNMVTGLGVPSAGTDAANKNYVDASIAGLSWKTRVRAASTANVDTSSAPASIDGVTLASGDRVLLKNQSTGSENGIYVFTAAAAALTRASDADTAIELEGAAVFVTEGSANPDTAWTQTADSITLGVTTLVFTQFAGASTVQAGIGLSYSGATLNVNLGAGISELPTDEVGIDVHSAGGLFTTVDNSASSSATGAQLAVKLDGSTLSKSSNGLKVATGGITNAEVSASAAIAYSKLALSNSIVAGDLTTDSVTSVKIAAAAVDENKLAASVAGAGLSGGAGTALAVNVDASTIEINSDTLRVKDLGITTAKIAAAAVDETKLAASVAGAGLSGGAGSALAVNVDASTIEINSDTLRVKDAGVTLAKLASDSVDENKIVSTAHDATLSGGSGSKLSVVSSPLGLRPVIAGESMAANTSFLVRWALTSETAGRVYKADKDASVSDKFYAWGIALSTSAVSAGGSVNVTYEGTHTLGSSDTNFAAGDVGKAVYLTASGAFSVTAPSALNEAVWRVGVVQDVNKIWVGDKQLNGIN